MNKELFELRWGMRSRSVMITVLGTPCVRSPYNSNPNNSPLCSLQHHHGMLFLGDESMPEVVFRVAVVNVLF